MAIGIVIDDQTVPKGVGQTNPIPVGTDYTVAIEYDVNNNPLYIGEAVPGITKSEAEWRIQKLVWDDSGNLTDILWADGVKTFTKIWNNKTDYTFS